MSCGTKPGLASNPPHLLAPPAIGQGLHHPLGAILFPGTPGSCFRRPPPAHGPCCSSASGPAPSPGRLPAALRRQRQPEALPAARGLSSHGSGQPLRLGAWVAAVSARRTPWALCCLTACQELVHTPAPCHSGVFVLCQPLPAPG